ncbi:LeuD2 [Desulforapulum autotrophicum HRM2]|jgi:3-isopropylmalate/(R)-2-methylmalate dehydratase small subunit|uniref:3-isopropylmalate dehydratase small subunit n=1 Tax=Desulforapulum autotrophicum (strain ATCC 43914 / DSM 3382 / VKM B-1955 / HRM2) TaxID=177437 RepID=LEUD_DESAH|nr:3-isopropylmalate dehydratase small subunit [Desulforapulum autotrophicum]C0QDY4.1 RecName: Full=3-isopropylmalate dehydratase small subunit; AltName: Full=Alpha-IPM isomerase; Short=IPMI; AltName: Full=Isopropylmalate isomerase [Desulforapulum autotrophicum HRM2]ACN17405.1 LeuD2 [Desulforapulum autotrophicum HRM2]
MKPFTTHTGVIATLNRSNVDTDAIIPKQFLKSIKRTGYGPSAFYDWRYTADGRPDPNFELNHPRFEGRSILVTRNNFGCGSSREHAVWALVQDGYRVIIAPWKEIGEKRLPAFADIFLSNTTKNGMLCIELSETIIDAIFEQTASQPGLQATVDLTVQQLTIHGRIPATYPFQIEEGVREQLINGLDEIALSLKHEADIAAFEARRPTWMDGRD